MPVDSFTLWCLVDGDSIPFKVRVQADNDMDDLKELIREKGKHGAFANVDATDLVLWKLHNPEPVEPEDELGSRIRARGYDIQSFATKLGSTKKVEQIFLQPPRGAHIHIIVKLPPAGVVQPQSVPALPTLRSVPTITAQKVKVTVVPIKDEVLQNPFNLEVRPTTEIVAIRHRIRGALKAELLIGEYFSSSLEILPLRTTPTLDVLKGKDLANLRKKSQRRNEPSDNIVSNFFQPASPGGVHFLVWLPQGERFPDDPRPHFMWHLKTSLLDTFSFENATAASQCRDETQGDFKAQLKRHYGQPGQGDLFDMATGKYLPHNIVVAAQIFQRRWREKGPHYTMLQSGDIDDVRNGLFLYKPVEWAFDRAKICIEVNSEGKMSFLLLDEELRAVELATKACELRHKAKHGNQRIGPETDLRTTFGDLDRQELQFPVGVTMRPSKRLLGLHASAAWMTAQHRSGGNIPIPSCNASDDGRAEQAIKTMSINEWRRDVV